MKSAALIDVARRGMRYKLLAIGRGLVIHLAPQGNGRTLCGRVPSRVVKVVTPETRICGTCRRELESRVFGMRLL